MSSLAAVSFTSRVSFRAVQTDPDHLWSQRLRSGDKSVLAEIYSHCGPDCYRQILRKVKDRDHAEDLQQQVFTEVWHKRESFDPSRSTVMGWISTIAHSRTLDFLRKRIPQPLDGEAINFLAGSESDVSGFVEQKFQVAGLLQVLPSDEREILRLRFYEDLSQTEISERLQLPLGTVKSKMVKALKSLRVAASEEGVM